jgi:protein AFG1
LQKLYDRLIDYEPSVEYAQRLRRVSRVVDAVQNTPPSQSAAPELGSFDRSWIWKTIINQKEKRDSLALTRVLTDHEEAVKLQSPKGLMLHGDVGTGKSMLIDLFQDCLPNRKKRRWHFDTFMLHTISRLEQLRKTRALAGTDAGQDEHSLLVIARDLIETSPVLFLDEFQFPDRVAAKILSNLMTSFFQLGGVLIATSNRMPDELAKAAGMEFVQPAGRLSRLGWRMGMPGSVRKADGPGQTGEFAAFLEVLKARCEVWEIEGKKDYRKLEIEDGGSDVRTASVGSTPASTAPGGAVGLDPDTATEPSTTPTEVTLPKNYLVQPGTAEELTSFAETFNTLIERATAHEYPIPWTPATLTVYGRKVDVPAQYNGVAFFTFSELCGAILGPADYVSLASTYHTFVVTDIPVLTFVQKHEARRLITLLDALYEARCRLLITAAAGPDDTFFPAPTGTTDTTGQETLLNDATYPETYSEIHQDLTSPFRPNISSYSTLNDDALEDDPPNRARRSSNAGSSRDFDDEPAPRADSKAPNFANLRGLTGEDEVFAVKRAQSRIWEMCSRRWWERGVEAGDEAQGWWRPLAATARHWEGSSASAAAAAAAAAMAPTAPDGSDVRMLGESSEPVERTRANRPAEGADEGVEAMFPHGASPFRSTAEAPPKFDASHAWGTVRWGKKAGAWGKGVEGLEERRKEKRKEEEGGGEGKGEKK